MADIKALAVSAKAKLDKGDAINVADALSKAIVCSGIRHRADHKRLMSEVGKQYNRDRTDDKRRLGGAHALRR